MLNVIAMTKLKYPKNLTRKQKLHIKSAFGSCALEGFDNVKIQQKIINDIASGKTLEQRIAYIKKSVTENTHNYCKQFD